MNGLKTMLLKEQNHLETIVNQVKERLESVPDGHLRISKDRNNIRYYQCTDGSNGIYIPKVEERLPRQLAQKTYDMKVLKKAETMLKQIKKMTKEYSDDEIEQVYKSLNKERQALIIPVEPTWEQTLAEWYLEEYEGKEFQEGAPLILTEKGERVRSKSEKILADFFYRKNILYRYEKPLHLKGYGIVYPDFTFLSKKTGQEIYWEHEGMMDKPDYARKAVYKIESYQNNGIYIGERLILTFETEQSVLNSKIVEQLAERYL